MKRSGRARRRFVFLFVAILIVLAVTNPTKEDYINYTVGQPSGTLATLGANFIAKPLLDAATTRTNYYIFSIFKTNVLVEQFTVLGFGRNVFWVIDQ